MPTNENNGGTEWQGIQQLLQILFLLIQSGDFPLQVSQYINEAFLISFSLGMLIMHDMATNGTSRYSSLCDEHFLRKGQRGHVSRSRQAGLPVKNMRLFIAGRAINLQDQHGLLHRAVSFHFSAEKSKSWDSEKDKFELKPTR